MTDFGDDAQRWREAEEAETLRRARLEAGISAYQCIDRHNVIPSKRRNLLPGVKRCVRCQAEKEMQEMES